MQIPSLVQNLDQEPDQEPQQSHRSQSSEKTLIAESLKPEDLVTIADESDHDQCQPRGDLDLQATDAVNDEHDRPCDYPEEGTQKKFGVPAYRRSTSKGKKRYIGPAKRKAMAKRKVTDKRLKLLNPEFKPICFAPHKAFDFAKHEKVLKRLGLWDFVHLKFDRDIRRDLLSQLVVNYSHGVSFVNYVRVVISRAVLARALKLPKKEKFAAAEEDMEEWSVESLAFIEDFTMNWVLLHEDMWMMPIEVMASTRLIKEGHPEKVDWANLMWFMVEKELQQGVHLGNCYYAAHLQCAMKLQKKIWFEEQPEEDSVPLKEESDGGKVDVSMEVEDDDEELEGVAGKAGSSIKEEEDDEGDGGDTRMTNLEEFPCNDSEGQNLELTLGQEKVVKRDAEEMDFEESKEEEHRQWFLDGNFNGGELYLRQCNNLAEFKVLASDIERKVEVDEEEDEEGEEEGRFNLDPKCNAQEVVSFENLIPTMVEHIPFPAMDQLQNHSSGELLASTAGAHTISTGPSMFSSAGKRVFEHGDSISLHPLDGNPKRLKINGPRANRPEDFDSCMDHVGELLGRAKSLYQVKEQAWAESNINQQFYVDEIQQLRGIVGQLQRDKFEEVHKKQMEVYRLERELIVMGSLLRDYRKAIKETNKEFAEYRQRCPALDEPLYKDVPRSGGLVLSTAEIEKRQQKYEMEERSKRHIIEKSFEEFEQVWIKKLKAHLDEVSRCNSKADNCANDVDVLKDLFAKRKQSNHSGRTPEE